VRNLPRTIEQTAIEQQSHQQQQKEKEKEKDQPKPKETPRQTDPARENVIDRTRSLPEPPPAPSSRFTTEEEQDDLVREFLEAEEFSQRYSDDIVGSIPMPQQYAAEIASLQALADASDAKKKAQPKGFMDRLKEGIEVQKQRANVAIAPIILFQQVTRCLLFSSLSAFFNPHPWSL